MCSVLESMKNRVMALSLVEKGEEEDRSKNIFEEAAEIFLLESLVKLL